MLRPTDTPPSRLVTRLTDTLRLLLVRGKEGEADPHSAAPTSAATTAENFKLYFLVTR